MGLILPAERGIIISILLMNNLLPAEKTVARVSDPNTVPAIEVSDLVFRYGERTALDEISFTISRGESFAFLGPNGSGKTTLFRILSTLVAPQSGRIRMLGHDLADSTLDLRRRIGVVFQHPSIDGKLTVVENLHHHGHLYGLTGRALRERCNTMSRNLGIAERRADVVETLSGGLQRRVELAKALLHQPELLLLDEPSTGLDPMARREFQTELLRLRDECGVTVVLTTHYMDEAERCDRIGVVHNGRLVAIAPPHELKASVGGDVIVIRGRAPDSLAQTIGRRLHVNCSVVDGTVRIERPRGHELVRDIAELCADTVESITFGKPTLEDAFVHLTGERFVVDRAGEV
jgi:ABC-2 type transport system ATP-binding protein